MPSFDAVSEVDLQELRNAIDQANRELGTRYDFRNLEASFALSENRVLLTAPEEFHLGQMLEILHGKCAKRRIDISCLRTGKVQGHGKQVQQPFDILQGLDKDTARIMLKQIKTLKLKVSASIQDDKVRVTGKKRNDLQEVIAFLKKEKFDRPLQFRNFRD